MGIGSGAYGAFCPDGGERFNFHDQFSLKDYLSPKYNVEETLEKGTGPICRQLYLTINGKVLFYSSPVGVHKKGKLVLQNKYMEEFCKTHWPKCQTVLY